MKINQDNYEQYFLDHTEGSLSPDMERELELFLEANPDLKPVLESYDPTPLPAPKITSNRLKSRLKKNIHPTVHINEANVDEWLSADAEGQLGIAEKSEFQEFIRQNHAYEYDRTLMLLSRLEPDLSVIYQNKNQLKKKAAALPLVRLSWAIPAVAALILVFFGIKFLNRPEPFKVQPIKEEKAQQVAKEVVLEKGTPSARKADSIRQKGGLHPPERRTPSLFKIGPINATALTDTHLQGNTNHNLTYNQLPDINFEEEKKPSLLARIFGNLVVGTRNALRNNPDIEKVRNADVDFWSIAEAGVKGFNTVTDRDLQLKVRKDEEGRVKSYALVEDDHLIYSKSRSKN
jgi:hypothetical protein